MGNVIAVAEVAAAITHGLEIKTGEGYGLAEVYVGLAQLADQLCDEFAEGWETGARDFYEDTDAVQTWLSEQEGMSYFQTDELVERLRGDALHGRAPMTYWAGCMNAGIEDPSFGEGRDNWDTALNDLRTSVEAGEIDIDDDRPVILRMDAEGPTMTVVTRSDIAVPPNLDHPLPDSVDLRDDWEAWRLAALIWDKACKILEDYDITLTDRTPFYCVQEWAERGEAYGANSKLVIMYDGSPLGMLFGLDKGEYDKYEEMRQYLASEGFFTEEGTMWYSCVYPKPRR
jgi:hypothetical protein